METESAAWGKRQTALVFPPHQLKLPELQTEAIAYHRCVQFDSIALSTCFKLKHLNSRRFDTIISYSYLALALRMYSGWWLLRPQSQVATLAPGVNTDEI